MLFERAHLEYREADHVPIGVDLLHYLVVGCLPEIAFLTLKDDFQIIAFGIIPDCYVLAFHRTVPFFGLSVR